MTVETKNIENKIITEMAEAGVLYSHKKSKADPRMKPFVVTNRHQLDVLDAGAVLDSIEKTGDVLKKILSNDGRILFVGTTPPARELVKNLAEKLGQPYIINRWLGGTLTNLKVMKRRVSHYLDLKEKRSKGELDKYTKKEQVEFDKEIDQLTKKFDGVVNLDRLPDVVFIVDVEKHPIAINESKHKDVPVVAIIDTNDNPEIIDYPIIANDHSRSSLEWVLNKLDSEIVISDVKNKKKKKKEDSKEKETKEEGVKEAKEDSKEKKEEKQKDEEKKEEGTEGDKIKEVKENSKKEKEESQKSEEPSEEAKENSKEKETKEEEVKEAKEDSKEEEDK